MEQRILGFWPVLAAVFAAAWIGGIAAALLWSVICAFALVDVLHGYKPAAVGRSASSAS
jgi:hypothetical protein